MYKPYRPLVRPSPTLPNRSTQNVNMCSIPFEGRNLQTPSNRSFSSKKIQKRTSLFDQSLAVARSFPVASFPLQTYVEGSGIVNTKLKNPKKEAKPEPRYPKKEEDKSATVRFHYPGLGPFPHEAEVGGYHLFLGKKSSNGYWQSTVSLKFNDASNLDSKEGLNKSVFYFSEEKARLSKFVEDRKKSFWNSTPTGTICDVSILGRVVKDLVVKNIPYQAVQFAPNGPGSQEPVALSFFFKTPGGYWELMWMATKAFTETYMSSFTTALSTLSVDLTIPIQQDTIQDSEDSVADVPEAEKN